MGAAERSTVSNQMVALCREVNLETGEIVVYPLDSEVTDNLIFCLGLRARANPELRYFVVLRKAWETIGERDRLTKVLKRKGINRANLEAIGGISEL